MAVSSMTGCGQGRGHGAGRSFVADARSVNGRFLEVKLRLPPGWQAMEGRLNAVVRKHLTRGRVDLAVTCSVEGGDQGAAVVDEAVAEAAVRALERLAQRLGLPGRLTASDLVTLYGSLLTEPVATDLESAAPAMEQAVEQAIAGLRQMRASEGEALSRDFHERLTALQRLVTRLQERAPDAVREQQQRLGARVAELVKAALPSGAALDQARLMQECALLAERSDAAEELTRLNSHLQHFQRLMASAEPAGRKLDFLCQELNREANTLGAKGHDAVMAELVVELKAEIERLREQVQNVE